MFSLHITREEFKIQTIHTGRFGFVFEENSARKSHDYCDAIVFDKPRFRDG